MKSNFFVILFFFSVLASAQDWIYIGNFGDYDAWYDKEGLEVVLGTIIVEFMFGFKSLHVAHGEIFDAKIIKMIVVPKLKTAGTVRHEYFLKGKSRYRINIKEEEVYSYDIDEFDYVEGFLMQEYRTNDCDKIMEYIK